MSSNTNPLRAKNMMYTQQVAHLPAGDIPTLVEMIKKLRPKQYAVILHDKDMNEDNTHKSDHVHAMISFENARSVKNVAKQLNDLPQSIEAWRGEAGNGYAYLCHCTDNAKSKYQYPPADVIASFDYVAELQQIEKSVIRAKSNIGVEALLNALYEGVLTKAEVEQRLSGAQYGKAYRQIEKVHAKFLQKQAKAWRKDMRQKNREVTTIWLYGAAETGKTSLAKELAKRKGQEYYVSGSHRDVFQSYQGEHTLLLEELRPSGAIAYDDLLRITDPFALDAEVMAPSRYSDKSLAVDFVIVTSPFNPHSFYENQLRGKYTTASAHIDSFKQLLRRITLTIEMQQNEFFVAEFDDSKDTYMPVLSTAKPNPYSVTNRPTPVVNPVTVFDSLLGSIWLNATSPKSSSATDIASLAPEGDDNE